MYVTLGILFFHDSFCGFGNENDIERCNVAHVNLLVISVACIHCPITITTIVY